MNAGRVVRSDGTIENDWLIRGFAVTLGEMRILLVKKGEEIFKSPRLSTWSEWQIDADIDADIDNVNRYDEQIERLIMKQLKNLNETLIMEWMEEMGVES